MPKATKKTVKKNVKKVPVVEPVEITTPVSPVVSAPMKPMMSNKVISLALLVLVIALLTYKLGPWLVPAVADNRLVTRFELWSRLEKTYGAQALDDMVNEKILDKAIADSNITVDEAKFKDQITTLEKQFEANGGLEEALKQRGLSRSDLEKQVRTQLAVEELLADKIKPSDEDVKKQFDDNAATLYKDKKFEDVKAGITDELKQAKLRDEFLAWFAEVKKTAKVKTFGL